MLKTSPTIVRTTAREASKYTDKVGNATVTERESSALMN
jgi:hypothetical protein